MSKFLGWRTQSRIAEGYTSAISNILSSDDNFNNFRHNKSGYTPILEHLNQNDGLIYGNYVKTNYPEMMKMVDSFKKNDSIGNPLTFNYDSFGDINPTTLRYIKFAGDIKKRFGDLTDYNLVEIGGGYGGLVRVLTELYVFKSIKMFDLPEALKLQKKYLNEFDINVETYTHEDEFNIDKKTLVISNYAWCECDIPTRQLYVDEIISKCELGYMVVYDVNIDKELMSLDGEKFLEKEILNTCQIFTLKNNG